SAPAAPATPQSSPPPADPGRSRPAPRLFAAPGGARTPSPPAPASATAPAGRARSAASACGCCAPIRASHRRRRSRVPLPAPPPRCAGAVTRRTLRRRTPAAAPAGARLYQLDHRHVRAIADPLAQLDDARVAAGAGGVARRHIAEQLIDHVLVGHERERLAA